MERKTGGGLRKRTGAKWIVAIALAVSIFAGNADAQSQWFGNWGKRDQKQQPRPAVVRVVAEDGDGLSQGSGALIAVSPEHGIVITNWHVVRDAVGKVTVKFPDGFQSAAQILKVDSDWDLAALGIWRPSAEPLPIARVAPVAGEALTIAGYGPGEYREATGRLTQYVAPAAHLPYEMFEVDVEARNGDSGGPILNARGELAGVLFGAATGTTAGSFCGRVREFLGDVLPLIERPEPQAGLAMSRPREDNRDRPSGQPPSAPTQPPAPSHTDTVARSGAPPSASLPNRPDMETVFLPGNPAQPPAPVSAISSQPLPPAPEPRTAESGNSGALANRLKSAARFLGDTRFDQIKTFLAIVGVVSIVMQLTGGRRRT